MLRFLIAGVMAVLITAAFVVVHIITWVGMIVAVIIALLCCVSGTRTEHLFIGAGALLIAWLLLSLLAASLTALLFWVLLLGLGMFAAAAASALTPRTDG